MAVSIKWHGAAFKRLTTGAINAGIEAATLELQRIARKDASTFNKGVPKRRTRDTSKTPSGGKKGSQYTIYPHSSKPGEPVRQRTGFGQDNIVIGLDRAAMKGRVGYVKNARYMMFHELGIRYRGGMQKRPLLVPAIVRSRGKLSKIAAGIAQRYAARRGE